LAPQYPALEEFIDDVFPKKGEMLEAKAKDRVSLIVADGEPLFFRERDGPLFPTLRLLHKCACGWGAMSVYRPRSRGFESALPLVCVPSVAADPTAMARIQVDVGAIKRVLGGANVMTPGILSAGGAIIHELPEGAPVAVYAQGKERALAIGIMRLSTEAV